MKAPNPTRLPAATLTLEAAPVESGPSAPVPVASVPVASASVPVASESEEPLPVASAPEAVVERLARLAGETGAQELMLTTPVYDLGERIASYELVRKYWGAAAGSS